MKIDLHVHTKYSFDNEADPEDTIRSAIRKGIDGIVFTEHDDFMPITVINNLQDKYRGYITLFRGMELSTAGSHTLIIGIQNTADFHWFVGMHLTDVITEADRLGGIALPSHPFRYGLGMELLKVKNLHALEGLNGHNCEKENGLAMQLALYKKIPYVGGSDSHSSDSVGRCYTEFDYIVDNTTIASAIKQGHCKGVFSQEYLDEFRIYDVEPIYFEKGKPATIQGVTYV